MVKGIDRKPPFPGVQHQPAPLGVASHPRPPLPDGAMRGGGVSSTLKPEQGHSPMLSSAPVPTLLLQPTAAGRARSRHEVPGPQGLCAPLLAVR